MSILEALVLGILQGITEFLPISSSGHLVVAESLMKLPVESLKSFDIAIHFGTLLAILIYFYKDFLAILAGDIQFENITAKTADGDAQTSLIKRKRPMLGYLIIGTVPAVIVGLFLGDWLDEFFRNKTSVAITLMLVGLLFFVAEWINKKVPATKINLKNTVLIGIAQSIALIPGVSRSGSTISAGLSLGLKREESARFSFLLGGVAIAAATAFSCYKIFKGEFTLPQWDILITGVLSSFAVGLLAISFLMRYLKKHTLNIFAFYRIILGLVVLFLLK